MKRRSRWIAAARFTGLGWYVATAIVAPTLAGAWLDGRVGTAPLFLLAGVLGGTLLAFCGTYRMAKGYLVGGGGSDADRETRE